MIEFLSAPANAPFLTALLVMLGIAFLEGVATVMGMGISNVIDSALPDLDMDADLHHPESMLSGTKAMTPFTKMLSWLRVGKVPLLILLIVFLTSFGLIGLTFQSVFVGMFGFFMPAWIASIIAVFITLPVVRTSGGVIAFVLPEDETEAVSEKTFIGRTATITIGTASHGEPAEAKLQDENYQTHYVMVEPDIDSDSFAAGSSVLIVSRQDTIFRVIAVPSSALEDKDEI